MYIYTHACVYIYIYRERERDIHIYICICIRTISVRQAVPPESWSWKWHSPARRQVSCRGNIFNKFDKLKLWRIISVLCVFSKCFAIQHGLLLRAARGRFCTYRGKILHTINRHLRNHHGLSVAFSHGFSVSLSNVISLVSGICQRIITFQVDFAGLVRWILSCIFQWIFTFVISGV